MTDRLTLARLPPDLLVIACGVVVAMQVGKLPAALPALREAFGLSLVQAGFLLSLVQLASMVGGLGLGLLLQRAGLRRGLIGGLLLVAIASAAGPFSASAEALLFWRAIEGLGVLGVALAAPSLLRELVDPQRMSLRMGLWGAYMPSGTGLALLAGPAVMAAVGWSGWWMALALLTLLMAALAAARLGGDDGPRQAATAQAHAEPRVAGAAAGAASVGKGTVPQPATPTAPAARSLLANTLRSPTPWLLALCFGAYSSQWLAVIGFLPTVYAEAGVPATVAGPLTAMAALVNIVGNVLGGRALHRGHSPYTLLRIGFVTMGLAALGAFGLPEGVGPAFRYGAVLLFSGVGGLVPATLFALAARSGPEARAMPYVVGLMTQGTGFGQMMGPPAVAWWASMHGGWSMTWVGTGSFALGGLALTGMLARRLGR